jgi:hypothetical protein
MEQPSPLPQKEAEATVPFTDESRQLLAERVRARDPAALQAVVKTYLPQVLRAARG